MKAQTIEINPDAAERAFSDPLLAATERLCNVGMWELYPQQSRLLWSENLYRLHGLEPGRVDASPELLLELTHPDDRERLRRELTDATSAKEPCPPLEYRAIAGDGTLRHLLCSPVGIEVSGTSRKILGVTQDLTEQRRAEGEIAAHVAVAEALSSWTSLATSGEQLLQGLARALGFERAVFWVPRGDVLTGLLYWHAPRAEPGDAFADSRSIELARGVGITGRAWEEGTIVVAEDLAEQAAYPFREDVIREGLRGGLAVPALDGEEVIAVITFGSYDQVELTERLRDCLVGIGSEIGAFLARHRGELRPTALTRRELEILQLAANGNSGPQIAEQLTISAATVKTHFDNIYLKLGVQGRAPAVAAALRDGLIS